VTLTEAERVLDLIASRYEVLPYDPERDVVITDLANKMHISYAQAQVHLEAEVAAGRMLKRHCNVRGTSRNVYRAV
jgi:hypothetical protein